VQKLLSYLRRQHAGLLALFIALSGTSYAVATSSIGTRDIRNNSVTSRDVRNNSLKGKDLRDGTVKSQDVRDRRILGVDIRNDTIGGEHIRADSLGDSELGRDSVSNDELRENSVRSDEVRNGSLQGDDFGAGVLSSDAVVRFDSFAVAAEKTSTEAVGCASGERALGGGVSFAVEHEDDRVTFSEPRGGGVKPSTQGAVANGWRAGIYNGDVAAPPRTANVWVLCASR
jgi:hypothetical protein